MVNAYTYYPENNLYAKLDPVLIPWVQARGLHLTRLWKDYQLRYISIGTTYNKDEHMRVEEPDEQGNTIVGVWISHYSKKPTLSLVIPATPEDLEEKLNLAFKYLKGEKP